MVKDKNQEYHPHFEYYRGYRVIERHPRREFREIVEKFWVSSEDYHDESTFEILPDANFDLMFILQELNCKLLFAGPFTKRAIVPVYNGKQYFGIRFRPGKMPPLAAIKPNDLVDKMLPLAELFGKNIDYFGERLIALKGIDAKQEFIEDIFKRVGPEFFLCKDLCSLSAKLVESYQGKIKVKDLAHRVGTSTRTLERHFLDHVGLSPKVFIRLVRFQNAIKKLKKEKFMGLADVAYDCGYMDQSHFIKDFKYFSGKSPGCVNL